MSKLSEVLNKLEFYYELEHDFGSDFMLWSAKIELHWDESGAVVISLHRTEQMGEREIDRALRLLGEGGMEHRIPFNNLEECSEILSRPVSDFNLVGEE